MKPCFLALALALPSAQAAVYAHYSFDTNYTDSSGNARHGTLVEGLGIPTTNVQPTGGAPAGTTGNSLIVGTAGDYKFGGGAMSFSTDRDMITVPGTTFANNTTWSISFWARVAAPVAAEGGGLATYSAATYDMVIGNTGNNNDFIALSQGGNSRFRNSTNTYSQDFGAGGVGTAWHFYALVADGAGGMKTYKDNVLLTSATAKDTAFSYNAIGEAYSVNTTANDFDFHGEIDEVWVFNEAINTTTIGNLYTINAVPEPSALLLLGAGAITLLGRRSRGKR